MKIRRKIKTAFLILLNNGVRDLFNTLKGYILNRIGPYKPDESEIAFNALEGVNTKGIMIDVGAHFGKSLAPFLQAGWQVFAFEPDSENRQRLNWSYGDCPNLVIDSRALSDQSENGVQLYRSSESSGLSSLSEIHSSHQPGEKVDVTTLEVILSEQKISGNNLDFLKIDTEGYDLHVLRGVPWGDVSPRLIVCEFENSKSITLGYTFTDLVNFLTDKEYRLIVSEWYPLRGYGKTHEWRRFAVYPCELEDPASWGNIFATKDITIYDSLIRLCGLSEGIEI